MTPHAEEARRVATAAAVNAICAHIACEGRWWDVDRIARMNPHELAVLASCAPQRACGGQLELFPALRVVTTEAA